MKDTLIVNLFGVPGAGKSTGAAYIFSQLKMNGINAELITEFAKDKVWEDNSEVFKNQAYIFGKQSFRISRCFGKVDVIVTDSPLPLSIMYNKDFRLTENFNKSVMDVFNSYNNKSYLLKRVKPYNPAGRHQTEEESDALGKNVIDLLCDRNIVYTEIKGNIEGYNCIVEEIIFELNGNKGEKNMTDLTKIDNALKNIYLDIVAEHLNTFHPFLSAVEHTTRDVWGKVIRKCVGYGEKYEVLTLELKNLYGTINLSEKALKACENNVGALVNLINDEMTEILREEEINMRKSLFEGGKITGLNEIFQKDGKIYGINRDKCPLLKPYMQENFGDLTYDKLAEVIKKLDCIPDFIITTHKIKKYLADFDDDITVLADVHCPKDTVYILNSNDFALHQLCDWRWLEGEDGKILRQMGKKPIYTATLVKYADLMCSNPSHQAMLSGVSC